MLPGIIPVFGTVPLITNPVSLGSAVNVTMTVSAACPAGSQIFVLAANSPTNVTVTAINDSAGNTYTKAIDRSDGINRYCSLWYSTSGLALTSGVSTITATGTGSTNFIAAAYCTGVKTSSPLDKTASAGQSSTSPNTGTTAALAQANELVIAGFAAGSSGSVSYVADATFTRLSSAANQGANFEGFDFEWKKVSATTAVTCTDTTTGLAYSGQAMIATFKGN